jgi:drug/metabolite transporter (DMT)-like permease
LHKKTAIKKNQLLAYLALATICLIWGTTFLGIRIGVKEFPPFLFAGIRQFCAGLMVIITLLLFQKEKLPPVKHIGRMALLGFFMMTLGNGLVTKAEVFVDSGIAAIICSIMPILVILINLFLNRDERPTLLVILGTFIGLSGIILVFRENLSSFTNPKYTEGIVLIFLATLSWAAGSLIAKRINKTSNLFMNAGLQMFFGGIWCLPLSFLFDDLTVIPWNASVFYSLTYLTIFGSALAYVFYFYAITNLPMTVASLYSYINPLVAVGLGWFVLDEKLNVWIFVAFLITITGIYMVNRGQQSSSLASTKNEA